MKFIYLHRRNNSTTSFTEICDVVSTEATSGDVPELFEAALRKTFKAARGRYENSVKKRAKRRRRSTKAKSVNASDRSASTVANKPEAMKHVVVALVCT